MKSRYFLGLLSLSMLPAAGAAEPTKEQVDFFEQKIRPILADNCYQCHSTEQGKSKGGLTLDTRSGVLKGGESGAALVPGSVEKSILYKAVTYKDSDLQMPPKSKGGKLAESQVADLAKWIEMGAPDPRVEGQKIAKLSGLTDKARQHWAYQPVKNFQSIPVPKVQNSAWVRTPIDSFVLAKLESKNMLPSPDADRETLLRRVSYDLTGLPPTYAEVEAFLADKSPNAYEKVVERLLASPAYGERWGRHWLDTARYSDTIGGERNARTTEYRYPDAWTYRDYVVKALNDDKPYTDFITEQLAADKIPGIKQDDSRLAALGFLTVGERFRNVNDIINDRIDTVSKGFLGLTVACARCHDHMFDPIPTRDYYALHGVFANISEPEQKPVLASPATDSQKTDFEAKNGALVRELQNRYYSAVDYYLAELRRAPVPYLRAAMSQVDRKNPDAVKARTELISKNRLDQQFVQFLQRGIQRNPGLFGPLVAFRDGRGNRFRRFGPNAPGAPAPAPAAAPSVAPAPAPSVAQVSPPTATAPAAPNPAPAAAPKAPAPVTPAAPATPRTASATPPAGGPAMPPGAMQERIDRAEARMNEMMGDKAGRLAQQFGQRLRQGPNKLVTDAIAAKQPKNFDEALQVYADLFTSKAAEGRGFLTAVRSSESESIRGYEDPDLVNLLRGPFEVLPRSQSSKDWIETAVRGWPNQMLGRARLNFGEINLLETAHAGAPAHAMVVQDKNRVVNSPVFVRGQSGVRGPVVPRGYLEILSPNHKAVTFTQGSGRMELANCTATKDNPLTARVAVNRIWMHHFGEGIVRTPDDLGVMSEPPTHPELLDYLSSWFMENDWSQKKLHKLIVLSRVYQESTHTRKEYETMDPENRLLWRANLRRLDFESTRDSLLVYSGQLDKTVGGKPINLTEEPYSFRRSVYGYVDRGNLPELMAHFDFSDPDMPNSKRSTTVVPQQALFLMNSPMAVDIARKILARQEIASASNDLSRIMAIYRIVFQRAATPQEIDLALNFVKGEVGTSNQIASAKPARDMRRGPRRPGAGGPPGRNDQRFGPVKNEGDRVERKPLTPWETYVQALLFSNEAAYVN